MANKREDFVRSTQKAVTDMALAYASIKELIGIYEDREYGTEGTGALTDEDAAAFGFTAADIAAFYAFAVESSKFIASEPATSGPYGALFNRMRNDR